jgi:hypothetical protein
LEALGVIEERLRNQEGRLKSNRKDINDLYKYDRERGDALIRIEGKQDEQGVDISELKSLMNKILWGLFGAIAVGLMFVVAVATLIIQAAN